MPKREVYFSVDVEASGPVPGLHWMCSFGVCRTDDVSVGMRRVLRPWVEEGLAREDLPAAMDIVAKGLPKEARPPKGLSAGARAAAVRAYFEREGVDAREALTDLKVWLAEQVGEDGRCVVVGAPVTFDFMWLYWYWWRLFEEMPPFGFAGLDLRSYFMGAHGVGYLGTGKQRYLKHYPNDFSHSHDPLEDARQQGQIWHDVTQARRARPKGIR